MKEGEGRSGDFSRVAPDAELSSAARPDRGNKSEPGRKRYLPRVAGVLTAGSVLGMFVPGSVVVDSINMPAPIIRSAEAAGVPPKLSGAALVPAERHPDYLERMLGSRRSEIPKDSIEGVVLGDSLGMLRKVEKNYSLRLEGLRDKESGCQLEIENHSKAGETAAGLLKRLASEEINLGPYQPDDIGIIQFGNNDIKIRDENGEPIHFRGYHDADNDDETIAKWGFTQSIIGIIEYLEEKGMKEFILVGPVSGYPKPEKGYDPDLAGELVLQAYDYIERTQAGPGHPGITIKTVSLENIGPELMLNQTTDYLHPADKGMQLIARKIGEQMFAMTKGCSHSK